MKFRMDTAINLLEDKLLSWINADRYLPIQLDITNLCNLRCTHCYHPHHNNQGALSLAQWLDILNQYDQMIARLRFMETPVFI
jgi:MoaA/NifB/PqqE/SkfB family radical SAM enzyme